MIKQQPFKLDGRKELGKLEMSKEVVVTLMDMGTLALFALISVEGVGILNKKEKKMKKKGGIKAKVLVVLGACIVTIFSVTAVAGMGALPQPVLNLGVITVGFDTGTNNQTTQPVQLLPEEVVGKGFYINLSCAIKDTIRRGAVQLKTRAIINLNHAFQTVETGPGLYYAKIEETISPIALSVVGDWILQQVEE